MSRMFRLFRRSSRRTDDAVAPAAPRSRLRRTLASAFRIALASAGGTLLLVGALAGWAFYEFRSDLPQNLGVVTDYRPLRASQIFSADGEMIGEFFVEKRVLVRETEIPLMVKRAFVAAEDVRFYDHGGVDYLGIARAAVANFRAGHVVQGGSSITQQVAKLLIVGQERSLARKVREALLAFRIESRLSKDQILGIYLNHVYLGFGAYGLAAAANAYFGKVPSELTVAEAAMLAAMPKAPSRITPFGNFTRAQARQRYVLDQMLALGLLSPAEAEAAREEPLYLVTDRRTVTNVAAPYFVETVRRYVAERYGDEDLLENGLRVYTTLNMRKQRAAESAVRRGLEDLGRRLGFSGPIGHIGEADSAILSRGRPRPLSPAGFSVDDDEQSGAVVVPLATRPAVVDISRGNAALNPEAAEAARNESQRERRRAAKTPPPPAFPTDPDTTYAGVVLSATKPVLLASGALHVRLEPADEAKALAWKTATGERLKVGDILPILFRNNEETLVVNRRRAPPAPTAVLANRPALEGALVAVDPATGDLVAMVGGYDYGRSQFNRATQSRRQIGSAMKPFIYAAAIDSGLTPVSIRWDTPVSFKTSSGIWSPRNYKPEYLGALTLRSALSKSINTISAQLVAEVGVSKVIGLMRDLGVTSKLPQQISLSLGTADLGLSEVAYALAAFPAGGKRVEPRSILRITDADGRRLEDRRTTAPKVIQKLSPETAYVVTDMMKGVIESGTGKKALALGRPAGGKTGTSTNFRDAWFFGFTADLVCGVWVGRDDFKPMGHDVTGGQVSVPIWLEFMRAAHEGLPVRDFPVPAGVVFARANAESGRPTAPGDARGRLIPFKRGTLPAAFRGTVGRFTDANF
jgi:penicillin-binding protein 1A